MTYQRPMPYEALIQADTVDEGLKRIIIDYAIPPDYVPEAPLREETMHRSITHTIAMYAIQPTWLMTGIVYYHTDQLLLGLPAKIDNLDHQAIFTHPYDFYPYIGKDLTKSIRYILRNNIVESTHTILNI